MSCADVDDAAAVPFQNTQLKHMLHEESKRLEATRQELVELAHDR